jgi:hypothetical protein
MQAICRKKKVYLSRPILTFGAIAALLLIGCKHNHNVSMTITQEGKNPAFHFQFQGINGFIQLRLWRADTKQVLWDINLNDYCENHLGYGEIPTRFKTFNGNVNDAVQNFPKKGEPLSLPPNTTFIVELSSQYDADISAYAETGRFSFSTDTNNVLSQVTIAHIAGNDIPDESK